MTSARYRDWFDAIRNKRRVCYLHQGKRREGCPHVLGLDKNGEEKVLIYRVIPGGLQVPKWRCLFVAETAIAGPALGPWLESDSHKQRNSCVVDVHIDVNRAAKQRFDWPGRKKKSSGSKTTAKRTPKKKKPRTR